MIKFNDIDLSGVNAAIANSVHQAAEVSAVMTDIADYNGTMPTTVLL